MCKGSKAVKTSVDAVQGETYALGQVSLDGAVGAVGALHAADTKPSDCIVCVQTGQKLTLSNIPVELQRMFMIGETAVATFEETKEWHRDDVLDFGCRKRVQFRKFADCGVSVYVGEKTAGADKIIADLLVGAASVDSAPVSELATTNA